MCNLLHGKPNEEILSPESHSVSVGIQVEKQEVCLFYLLLCLPSYKDNYRWFNVACTHSVLKTMYVRNVTHSTCVGSCSMYARLHFYFFVWCCVAGICGILLDNCLTKKINFWCSHWGTDQHELCAMDTQQYVLQISNIMIIKHHSYKNYIIIN